jgi:hypothetical protein
MSHESVQSYTDYGHYHSGSQALPEQQERHEMAVFFHQTENLMAKLGVLAPGSTRTRGRKSTIPGIQHSKRR